MVRAVAMVVAIAGCGRFGFGGDPLDGAPDGGSDAVAQPDAVPDRPNLAFVTSAQVPATFGGLAGADALCMQYAQAAALPGEFVALLWSGGVDPTARLAGSRGWVDPIGRPIADQPADWVSLGMFYPLQVNEFGGRTGGNAWYGSAIDDCAGWTSATSIGQILDVLPFDEEFDSLWNSDCPTTYSLVCVERGHSARVAPVPETGRIAFVTAATWQPGGGLAAADALCQAEASGAGLTATFLAFLGSGGLGPEARFSGSGLPWRRVDGVRLTQTASEFLSASGPPLDTFLDQTATGAPTMAYTWLGGGGNDCEDWTNSGTGGVDGAMGFAVSTTNRSLLRSWTTFACGSASALICLEP